MISVCTIVYKQPKQVVIVEMAIDNKAIDCSEKNNEPPHQKSNNLRMRKQRRRSASQ